MLYNYPQKDILKMIHMIEESNEHVQKSNRLLALESNYDLKTISKSMKLSSMAKISLADLKNGSHSKNNLHMRSNREVSQSPHPKIFNAISTNMNNYIRTIVEIVYDEAGEGQNQDLLSYSNFLIWLNKNKGILETFDKWLKKDIWAVKDNLQFSYRKYNPISCYAKVKIKRKSEKLKFYKQCFIEYYQGIIYIYKESSGKTLKNIVILRNIQSEVNENEFKISLLMPNCSRYRNVKIIFPNLEKFRSWKLEIEPQLKKRVDDFYIFQEKIGKGTFSTVNLAMGTSYPQTKVAIKTIEKANVKPEEKALISEESIIMQKLNHPSIVKFIEQFEDSKKIYYVLELAKGNDLYSYILKNDRLSENMCRQIMKKLFEVMHYLHQNQILHRDLKPENIMISFNDDENTLKSFKLIDFGFATYFSEDSLPNLSCGTLNYAAPEVLLGENYSTPSDVFSCGVILYLM